jgi:nickel-dependent lactate racemase
MDKAFRYGRGSEVLTLPGDGYRGTIQPKLPAAIQSLDDAIGRRLAEPISCPPLLDVVRGRKKIVIAVPDATRGEAVRACLPPLLRYLENARLERDRVTILIATGHHRPPTPPEIAALVGREIAAAWRVVAHDPDAGNVELEPYDADTPIFMDRIAVESDCLILAGSVSYHYAAGFGGGRKMIAPGLAGRATVQALHRRTVANIDEAGRWQSRTGQLRGNPFHEVLAAVAERLRPAFAVQVSLGWEGRAYAVTAGDPVRSHQIACLEHDQIFRVHVPERLPLVIASCGGWPFDLDLYQAHKSIDNAFRAVAPGGTILLLARCADGWGAASFTRWLAIPTLDEHRARLLENFEVAGHTTYALKWKATQCRIVIASDVLAKRLEAGDGPQWLRPDAADSPFRLEIVPTLREALTRALARPETPYSLLPVAAFTLPEAAA